MFLACTGDNNFSNYNLLIIFQRKSIKSLERISASDVLKFNPVALFLIISFFVYSENDVPISLCRTPNDEGKLVYDNPPGPEQYVSAFVQLLHILELYQNLND